MRILYLSQVIPYPVDSGPKTRTYHVLQYLWQAGHEITLMAFRKESDRHTSIEHVSRLCAELHTVHMARPRARDAWRLLRSLSSDLPFLITRDDVAEMHRAIQGVVADTQFDAVHADQLSMANYAINAVLNTQRLSLKDARQIVQSSTLNIRRKPRLVLDQHSAAHLIPKQLASGTKNPVKQAFLRQETRKLADFEVKTCSKFDHVVWMTEEDRKEVGKVAMLQSIKVNRSVIPDVAGAGHRSSVIPICVDPLAKPRISLQSQPRRVTFLGSLRWPPDAEGILWFARDVWPFVRAQVPDAILTIMGECPSAELGSLTKGDSRLEVTGYVDDPTPYLEETAAFIVPLHAAGGMQLKIIDAWAWGVPVVSTTPGAQGLRYRNGYNLLIADDANGFAEAVLQLLADESLRGSLVWEGGYTVEDQYDWRRTYEAWDEIYCADGYLTAGSQPQEASALFS